MTGYLSVRIMWLSGISGHGVNSLISQWGSTIKSPWVCSVTSRYPSWYYLRCCQDVKPKQPCNHSGWEGSCNLPVRSTSRQAVSLHCSVLDPGSAFWQTRGPRRSSGVYITRSTRIMTGPLKNSPETSLVDKTRKDTPPENRGRCVPEW